MRADALMLPSQESPTLAGVGGITSAIGCPRRVTRMGDPVRRTRSKTARQVALNSEMEMDSMGFFAIPKHTIISDYSQY